MGSTMADLMRRRQAERQAAYDAQWDDGRGSHHPDFDPTAAGAKASRCAAAAAARAAAAALLRAAAAGALPRGGASALPLTNRPPS